MKFVKSQEPRARSKKQENQNTQKFCIPWDHLRCWLAQAWQYQVITSLLTKLGHPQFFLSLFSPACDINPAISTSARRSGTYCTYMGMCMGQRGCRDPPCTIDARILICHLRQPRRPTDEVLYSTDDKRELGEAREDVEVESFFPSWPSPFPPVMSY